jgi:hypothetical protein
MLFQADFGGGKSHLLEYMSHEALQANFAVSRVVVSKETQLSDPAKVFRAAVESLVSEGVVGDALRELALTRLQPQSVRFAEFRNWLTWATGQGLNTRFEATVWLFEQARADASIQDELVSFWEGAPIGVGQLRKYLKQCGAGKMFALEKATVRELARQRFRFMAQLLRAAGFDGWVILLDELELMGRYTVLQRGRAYAELCRLLGLAEDLAVPGLLTIGAIAPDFAQKVIWDKNDKEQIAFRFRARGDVESELTAALAETTMAEIEHHVAWLREPDASALAEIRMRLTDVYEIAHDWAPSDGDATWQPGQQMREYVRSWITKWDLARLDASYKVDIEIETLTDDYTEEALLERSGEEDDAEGPAR